MGLKWTEQELLDAKKRMGRGGVKDHDAKAGLSGLAERRSTSPMPASNPAPSPQFDSSWEAEYAGQLELGKRLGTVKAFWYHPTTFRLPGGVKYTPDFLVQYPDGMDRRLQYVEIKGFSKNKRDGVTRYKIASGLFDCFEWVMLEKGAAGRWETIG